MSDDIPGTVRTDINLIPHVTPRQKRNAIRYICSANNATDAALLIDELGLKAEEGR